MLKCKVCSIEVNSPQLLEIHFNSTKHKMSLEKRPIKRKHDGDPNDSPAKRVAPNPEDADRTVFLKNMSYKLSEEDIRAVFEDCGEIESLLFIKDNRGWKKGLAYLIFKDKEAAVKALEKDNTELEKRPMCVSAYDPEENKDHSRNAEPDKNKLVVSGLPSTMTEEEIRALFEPHGEIKELRMLMKTYGFKGVCYLDYNDEETAAAVKDYTDQFEIGPEQKITVEFSYPPRTKKGDKLLHWCELCQLKFKGDEVSIKNHNAGTKHVKKEAEVLILHKLTQEYDCFETDPKTGKLRCVICNIETVSPQLLEDHLTGYKHKNNMQKYAANGSVTPAVVKKKVKNDCVSTAALAAAATNDEYWCEICKLKGKTTTQLIKTHMAGIKHKKKEASIELLQRLMAQEDCLVHDAVSGILKCLVCSLDAETPKQMRDHLAGTKHRIKAAGGTNTESAASKVDADGYWCQVCKLKGNHAPISLKTHMQGAKHRRNVAGEELLQKLKESTDCVDHDEVTGMFKCKVCIIEVNMPQLLEVHLNGGKHKMILERNPIKRKHDGDPNDSPAKRVAPNPEDAERTVFLKNMFFKSSEEDIRAVFEDCGEIESLFCIKDFRGRNKGFGYLMFKEKEAAVKALEKDKTVLKERPMYVSAYSPEKRKDHGRNAEPQKDKLFVSGLPNTITEEELRGLFELYGDIKELRMLVRKDVFKGLCYLDYNDEETAAAVKEATDQFQIGPEHKITVQFCYPPRSGYNSRRRHFNKCGGGANTAKAATETETREDGTNKIDAAAEGLRTGEMGTTFEDGILPT